MASNFTAEQREFIQQNMTKYDMTRTAVLAGAVALLSAGAQVCAQSSASDALIDKLEQKGILSADEAKDLRKESKGDFNKSLNDSFGKELSAKMGLPDWVTGYKLSGDFRGRFDDISSGNPASMDRIRLRYRLRVGLVLNMKDNFEVGFRLGSGDGGPLSNNQTLSGNASKKPLYVDTAYAKWTPIHNDEWKLAATIGKMGQPFAASPMVFDPDYTPEGGAIQAAYKFNDEQSLKFNGAAFVLDEISSSSKDPFLYGGQAIWDAKWASDFSTSLGMAAYNIVNKENLSATYDSNKGNTLAAGALVNNYNPVVISGSATYALDSFPLYKGAFPIKVGGEYMNNPGASSNNEGWWGGITFGKSGHRGNWDISYRYERLEGDAWWDQIVDDDNAGFVPTSPVAGGVSGGTNIKGHLVKLNYSLTDALTFTFTCYINDLINNPVPGTKTDAIHAMADLMWKF